MKDVVVKLNKIKSNYNSQLGKYGCIHQKTWYSNFHHQQLKGIFLLNILMHSSPARSRKKLKGTSIVFKHWHGSARIKWFISEVLAARTKLPDSHTTCLNHRKSKCAWLEHQERLQLPYFSFLFPVQVNFWCQVSEAKVMKWACIVAWDIFIYGALADAVMLSIYHHTMD